MRILQQVAFIIVLIIFLSAVPSVIGVNSEDKSISWNISNFAQVYVDFIEEISKGSLGTYTLGFQERQIADDLGNNFITSFIVLFVGVNVAVIFSLIFGIFISRFKLTRIINMLLNTLAAIPDFIIIIFSLVLAVNIYKSTGIRLLSLRPDAGLQNIWFPMILVGIAPTLYLFKLVAVKYYQISGEDYIRTAVAKGMRLNYINLQHVFKNIDPFIQAELTKVVSLAIGNMFIVEYLLNVPGITKFIFQSHQVQPIIIGLFSMLIISLMVYFSARALLYLLKRGFIYE
jgi:peptide/nickel transport system permease protein